MKQTEDVTRETIQELFNPAELSCREEVRDVDEVGLDVGFCSDSSISKVASSDEDRPCSSDLS